MPYIADCDRIRSVTDNCLQFKGDKRPVEMSMARLASAWGSRNRESRAVDIGIALESILMSEKGALGKEQSTEIRYKIGTRAAWLMGSNFTERDSIFRSVRRLYDCRSEAAHGGRVCVKPNNWRAVDAEIEDGIVLIAQLIKTLLARGNWPDWNRLVLDQMFA